MQQSLMFVNSDETCSNNKTVFYRRDFELTEKIQIFLGCSELKKSNCI